MPILTCLVHEAMLCVFTTLLQHATTFVVLVVLLPQTSPARKNGKKVEVLASLDCAIATIFNVLNY